MARHFTAPPSLQLQAKPMPRRERALSRRWYATFVASKRTEKKNKTTYASWVRVFYTKKNLCISLILRVLVTYKCRVTNPYIVMSKSWLNSIGITNLYIYTYLTYILINHFLFFQQSWFSGKGRFWRQPSTLIFQGPSTEPWLWEEEQQGPNFGVSFFPATFPEKKSQVLGNCSSRKGTEKALIPQGFLGNLNMAAGKHGLALNKKWSGHLRFSPWGRLKLTSHKGNPALRIPDTSGSFVWLVWL